MTHGLGSKVALVTGASKGIGAAIARRLAADGMKVVVNYAQDREGAERVVSDIVAAGGQALAVQADVTKEEQVEALFATIATTYQGLDVLINNAGVYGYAPLEELTPAEYHRQSEINVLGLLLTSQAAAAALGERGGSIVNISSGISIMPLPGSAVYASTKGAVDAITRSLAKELGPRGIRVNAVSPGPIMTEKAHDLLNTDLGRAMIAQTPLGRIGEPEEVADVASFFASNESRWVTGQVLQVSGGLV